MSRPDVAFLASIAMHHFNPRGNYSIERLLIYIESRIGVL